MYEKVLGAVLRDDEAEPFLVVEPLNFTFCHLLIYLSLITHATGPFPAVENIIYILKRRNAST
jgi:hypothetical protein